MKKFVAIFSLCFCLNSFANSMKQHGSALFAICVQSVFDQVFKDPKLSAEFNTFSKEKHDAFAKVVADACARDVLNLMYKECYTDGILPRKDCDDFFFPNKGNNGVGEQPSPDIEEPGK